MNFKKTMYPLLALRYKIGRRIVDRRAILQLCDPFKLDCGEIAGEQILFVRRFDDLMDIIKTRTWNHWGQSYLDELEGFMSDRGELCIATVDGKFGCVSWVRPGDAIPRWLMPVTVDDRVVSRGFTTPKLRGRGLYARCIARTYSETATDAGRFLADCHIWNAASIKQFRRSGFEIVGYGSI